MLKVKKVLFVLVGVLFWTSGCSSSNSSADWKDSFVVYKGDNYIVSDTEIPDEQLGEQVGKIDVYSDNEADVNTDETFSNEFPKGSKIYKVVNKDDKTLAVKTKDGNYEVDYRGKYGQK